VVIDIHAQDTNSPEQVLQRVGNYIISQTGDQVNDISTSAVISIPETGRLISALMNILPGQKSKIMYSNLIPLY
jgi:hypothetical protein